ncbi:MAG: acetylxylan esterase, partial [Lachnospiraceae bacterium]|nr:acetylxylan esterase [Lachnospiraceae bacterium]
MEKEKLRQFYQNSIYGKWRTGEDISYELLGPDPDTDEKPEGFAAFLKVTGGELVRICASKDGRSSSFVIHAYLPDEKNKTSEGPAPFIICMHPIPAADLALKKGYALLVMTASEIATDDTAHKGAFYDLYPYGDDKDEQTGVLMAWAWGASKILDAVCGGLGKDLSIDPECSMVTGVSRWGKATAVCGAFDERFKMTIPACSGAGGLALFDVVSEGKTYDFTSVGGPSDYTYGKNEPLDCLQSDAERGWFNDRFLEYGKPEDIPVGQFMLPVLAVSDKRYYFIIASYMGEDWVNAPAMWECYREADKLLKAEGLDSHLLVHFHKEGHAVIDEDMELITDLFDHIAFGKLLHVPFESLKTT